MSLILRRLRLVAGSPAVTSRLLAQSTQLPVPISSYFSTEVKPATKEQIEKLIKKEKVVVFMKGVPEEPRCGFSNAVVQILRMHGVNSYEAHDVLKDESIRQGNS